MNHLVVLVVALLSFALPPSAAEAARDRQPEPLPELSDPAWWEREPTESDAWRWALLQDIKKHEQAWAAPVGIVGAVAAAGVGSSFLLRRPGGFEVNDDLLQPALVTAWVATAISLAAYPGLASIRAQVHRAEGAKQLAEHLRRQRKIAGRLSLGLGIGGLALGFAAPFTFGLTLPPAIIMGSAGCIFAQVAFTMLIFETKARRLTRASEDGTSSRKQSRLPRSLQPPELVAAGPLGLELRF